MTNERKTLWRVTMYYDGRPNARLDSLFQLAMTAVREDPPVLSGYGPPENESDVSGSVDTMDEARVVAELVLSNLASVKGGAPDVDFSFEEYYADTFEPVEQPYTVENPPAVGDRVFIRANRDDCPEGPATVKAEPYNGVIRLDCDSEEAGLRDGWLADLAGGYVYPLTVESPAQVEARLQKEGELATVTNAPLTDTEQTIVDAKSTES